MATAEETQDMDKAQPVLYLHCTEASPKREEKDGGIFQCSCGFARGTPSSSVPWERVSIADCTEEIQIQSLTVAQKIATENMDGITERIKDFE